MISGVIDRIVTPDDADSEDYPSIQTMLRWIHWFQMNLANIEGYLRSAHLNTGGFSPRDIFFKESLLEVIRNVYQNWLEIILQIIYNSGGFLPGVPW